VTSDWINYAIIDDISDSFGPLIKQIEVEVDSIDDLVLLLRESEQSDMLRRIGSCRKMVMHLLRLLTSKSDVIRGLIKRSEDRTREYNNRFYDAGNPLINLGGIAGIHRSGTATPTQVAPNAFPREGAFKFMPTSSGDHRHPEEEDKHYNPDVTMYFGDIQGKPKHK
jgi:Mg2+ and Co2+ transporter CorA